MVSLPAVPSFFIQQNHEKQKAVSAVHLQQKLTAFYELQNQDQEVQKTYPDKENEQGNKKDSHIAQDSFWPSTRSKSNSI